MSKKNVKVKKGNGDISITIENNLNANNKQINNNNEPIEKRRRRKKKVENNDEINTLEELPPITDTSYIKPGPVGAFKMVRPAQPGAGAGPGAQEISFDNFQRFLAMLMENQRNGNPANNVRPPPAWGRGLVDDDDDEAVIIPPPSAAADVYDRIHFPPLPGMPDPVILSPPQPARTDTDMKMPFISRADSPPPPIISRADSSPPPSPASTDSDIFSLSSITTDDSVPTLLPKRLLKTVWVGADGKKYYEPPKRPPPASEAFFKVLQNMHPHKAAYYKNLFEKKKDDLMRDLEAGPKRRNTESLDAGMDFRD